MSEIRTNVIISEESNEYRSKINLSVANLDNNLYDNHSAFRTDINISTTLKDGSIQSIKTILELGNISLDFYLVDMTKLNQSILYFSKFFNMYFEPEVMWNLLSQGTNEQINISHLSNALSSYVKNTSLDSINSNIVKLRNDLDSHISNKTIHLSTEEKSFLGDIMTNPPWTNSSGGGGYSESFFELIDIGNGEYALVPKKYKGKNVGIISDTFITAGGINSNSSDSEITFNRLDNWEDYDENAGDVLSAVLGFDLKQRIEIIERNGTLNETQLSIYLSKNKYLTRTVADTIYASLNSFEDFKKEIESKILWEKINIGTETSPIWAVIPKDINGNSVGVISNTFITAGGINSDNNSSSQILTLGNLINVNDSVDDIENNSVVLIKEANSTEWSVKLLSDIGFNESQLSEFLIRNEYLKKSTADTTYASLSSFNTLNNKFTDFLEGSDTDSIINKWKELEEFLAGQTESSTLADLLSVKADKTDVNKIQGYFTNGSANNALKLGNQLPSYYATSSALNTTNTNLSNHITAYNTFVTATNNSLTNHNNRLISLENMFEWDGSKIKAKADFYSIGAVTAGGVSDGGSIGNIFNRLDTWDNYDANSGDVLSANLGYELYTSILRGVKNPYALTINGTPYDGSSAVNLEVSIGVSGDYLPLSGGTITGVDSTAYIQLRLRGADYAQMSNLMFEVGEFEKGLVGYYDNIGVRLQNNATQSGLALENNGTPIYYTSNGDNRYNLIHKGNFLIADLLTSSDNLNNYIRGLYGSSGTNRPANEFGYNTVILALPSARGADSLQIACDMNGSNSAGSPRIGVRHNFAWQGWSNWHELIHSGNIGSYITGGGSQALLTTGGTMRGNLSFYELYSNPRYMVGMYIYNNVFQITKRDLNNTYIHELMNFDLNDSSTNINWNLRIKGGGDYAIWAGVSSDNRATLEVVSQTANPCDLKLGADYDSYWSITARNQADSHLPRGLGIYSYKHNEWRMFIQDNGTVVIGNDTANVKGYKFEVQGGTYIAGNMSVVGGDINIESNIAAMGATGISFWNNGWKTGHIEAGTLNLNTLYYGQVNVGNNLVVWGSITHGSDIRYKTIDSYVDIDLETIANAPIINFRWTDRKDDRLYLGSSAQYWYNTSLCNGVIPTDNEKLWTMGYGEIALAGLVSVAKKVVNHEERLQIVEKELAEYKEENKQLKQQLNEYRRLS